VSNYRAGNKRKRVSKEIYGNKFNIASEQTKIREQMARCEQIPQREQTKEAREARSRDYYNATTKGL